jgi:uroporphyrinogen-III decarboxylase
MEILRDQYLDYMTFRAVERPLFVELFGPLVGPRQVREFIGPYYARVWDMLESRGAQIFQQDSDGNVEPVLDDFLAAGLNSSLPMEPAAGMGIVELRKKYGERLAMMGGIDKHVIRRSREDIRSELEYKLQPLMRESGGMVFSLDHRIPTGTPIELYRYYVRTAREILGLDPNPEPGWGRMAF